MINDEIESTISRLRAFVLNRPGQLRVVAEALGVTRNAVSCWSRRVRLPRTATLVKLQEFLDSQNL
jgi:hypothetical protein